MERPPDLVGTLDEGMMEQGMSDTQAYIRGKGGCFILARVPAERVLVFLTPDASAMITAQGMPGSTLAHGQPHA